VPSRRVAVAATGQQALEAGLGVVEDGGNAVDAALTAAFVAMATEPGVVSLGGGAYVAVWPADGDPVVVDGNVEMPGRGGDPARLGRGIREVVSDYGGGVTMSVGAGSVATPGIVPAFAVAAERYAVLPWARLLEPASEAARSYPMGAAAARYLGHVADSLFAQDEEARALVTSAGGRAPQAGELLANDALAETLGRLAAEGPGLFVEGDVGRALLTVMTDQGGLITSEDLAAYEPVVRPAHRMRVGEWEIATNPPPSVGGPMLSVMLGELARRPDWTWDDAIDIQRRVLAYRASVHDLSPDLEADGLDLLARVGEQGLDGLHRSSSTAHVSAVDSDGNACAVTMSSGYCAGMCIPGTGILLNNCLGEPELNRRGVHALAPGTRLGSNMAPSVARHDDGTVLAVGSPGADRITTALLQVLGGYALGGLDLQAAVDAPRLHLRHLEDEDGRRSLRIDHEADLPMPDLGLPTYEHPAHSMFFGGVAAAVGAPDGSLRAAADPRRAAAVAVSA